MDFLSCSLLLLFSFDNIPISLWSSAFYFPPPSSVLFVKIENYATTKPILFVPVVRDIHELSTHQAKPGSLPPLTKPMTFLFLFSKKSFVFGRRGWSRLRGRFPHPPKSNVILFFSQ